MIDKGHPLPVTGQARILGLSRSSVYYEPVGTNETDLALMAAIDLVHMKLPFYGVRRIRDDLCDKVYPYLLRGKKITRAGEVWCADVTYLPMARGFCYLVAVMDWASRRVLSFRLSNTLDASFCVEALEEALDRYEAPEIFNTDQGSQFTSEGFTSLLASHGVAISMDGRGRWMDNVMIERLWRSVKYEEVYLKGYETIPEARRELTAYFDFYNKRRRHQGLKNRTPDETYWSTLRKQEQAA